MKFILINLCLAFSFSSLADSKAASGGGTVPWPWPWAEECPIDFEGLKGVWVMTSGASGDSFLKISTTWMSDRRAQYIAVEIMDGDMQVFATGSTFTNGTVRTIRMGLRDQNNDPTGLLELKIYHRSQRRNCNADELVPIVTIKLDEDQKGQMAHYILRPRTSNSPEEIP